MLDFLRDLTKSAEEKQQEMLTAYVDGELSPSQRRKAEQLLADDPGLRAELAELQQFKQSLRQLPRRRVPRNFMLDPAVYGTPERQPLVQLYPVMRVAMTLTAVFLFIAVGAEFLTTGFAGGDQAFSESAPMVSQTSANDADAEEEMTDIAAAETTQEIAEAEIEASGETAAAPAAEADGVAEDATAEESAEESMEEAPADTAEETASMEEVAPMYSAEEAAPDLAVEATSPKPEAENQVEEESAMGTADDGGADEPPAAAMTVSPTPLATAVAPPSPTIDSPRLTATDTPTDRVVKEATPQATSTIPAPEADEGRMDEGTAVSQSPTIPSSSPPLLRIIQVVLGILLVILVGAVIYTRRLL